MKPMPNKRIYRVGKSCLPNSNRIELQMQVCSILHTQAALSKLRRLGMLQFSASSAAFCQSPLAHLLAPHGVVQPFLVQQLGVAS